MVPGRTTTLFAAFVAAALIAPASAIAINPVSFSQVGNLAIARDAPGAARLPDGRVLVAGGEDNSSSGGGDYDTTEFFNPSTSSFTPGPTMLHTHGYSPVEVSLLDGRVLIAGGYDGVEDTATAEVFNPANGTFSPVGNMVQGRENAPAATLPDGRVLVVGGFANGSTLNSTEFFDPKTNTFSSGPTLPYFVYSPGAAAVAGGRVLIAGGYDNNGSGTTLDKALLFDPSTNAFNPISNLPFPIYYPAGASLPQGRALLAGGTNDAADELDTALIFDPTTNSFTTNGIGSLIHKRQEAAAAELADGRVLVAGGYANGQAVNTAELLSVPSNAFKAKLNGRTITFQVSTEGVASDADSSTKVATTAKKKKKPKLVKTTKKHGGPGKIKVKVKLTKAGSAKLAEKGKLTIKAIYTPDGGLAAVKKLKLR